MKKILFIYNHKPNSGGITGQVQELMSALCDSGFSVKFISTHGSILHRINGIFKSLFFRKKYDLIIGVGCAYLGFIPITVAFLASKLSKTPIVYYFHDGQAPVFLKKYHKLVKYIFGDSDVVSISDFITNCFIKYGINAQSIPNHYNDIKKFQSKRKQVSSNNIMWARSFEELYQPELALKAAQIVCEKNRKIKFYFYGDGSLQKKLKREYENNRIIFLGKFRRVDFIEEYSKFSLMINTTKYDNFPLSFIEAGINHLSIISTRVGGIPSIYSADEVIYVESFDENELANKILSFYSDINMQLKYSRNLNSRIKDFSWENIKGKWTEIIENNIG